HTIYYDQLPHYFLEFDVFDRSTGRFLSTRARHALLRGAPVVSVPVIRSGPVTSHDDLVSLVQRSLYKSLTWKENLTRAWAGRHLAPDRLWKETDPADLAEGLYIKVEQDDEVVGRYKYVRASFLTAVLESESHWLSRPIVPNRLADGIDIFGASR
ncbi:MAG: RNA ligase family protein, partial [Candidatus Riflebacteria bacterium]|nr:RNA ligase family protein [Candidatus Riflebacteria bacterium]